MWKIILFVLAGAAAGVLGGMGMGGGTLLIPLLTIFFGVEQKQAQAVNLAAFVPMAIVSLIIHFKNGLVEKKGLLWIIIPAALLSAGGSLLASATDGKVLQRIFGGFLLLLSVFQFFSDEIMKKIEEKKDKPKENSACREKET